MSLAFESVDSAKQIALPNRVVINNSSDSLDIASIRGMRDLPLFSLPH